MRPTTNANGEVLAYTRPKSYLDATVFWGPVRHAILDFEGQRIYSARQWLWDGDSVQWYITSNVEKTRRGVRVTVEEIDARYDSDKPTKHLRQLGRIYLSGVESRLWQRYLWGSKRFNFQTDFRSVPGTHSLNRDASCAYCNETLLICIPPRHWRRETTLSSYLADEILYCANCGWWISKCEIALGDGHYSIGGHLTSFGTLRRYAIDTGSVPIDALRNWLRRHPESLAHVNPKIFERLVAACFRDIHRDVEVIHVGKSRDGGRDILFVQNDRVEALIQVKRRHDLGKAESVDVVRSLNGAMLRQGVPKGIVVTTAKRYSIDAVEEARPLPFSLATYSVDLLAFDDVVGLLNCRRGYWSQPEQEIQQHLLDIPIRRKVVDAIPPGVTTSDWHQLYQAEGEDIDGSPMTRTSYTDFP